MTQLGTGYPGNEPFPTDNTEGGEIPADLLEAARDLAIAVRGAVGGCTCEDCMVVAHEVALNALLAEREKTDVLRKQLKASEEEGHDNMYLTAMWDAKHWAKEWGYPDFAERLVAEVNRRADKSGLRKMEG